MTAVTIPARDRADPIQSAPRVLVRSEMATRSRWLWLIVGVSFFLNAWGITWGLPQRWHPDELTQRAENMVGDASINPHYFAYGGFHYYVIAALAVLPVKVPNKLFQLVSYETQSSIVVTLSRLISAAMGAGVVYLTFRIGASLFAPVVGMLAGALAACAMVLVNAAHFATTDVPSLFWFMLACAGATAVFRTGERSAYLATGVATGLAAAVKYVGGLALVALVVAHLLRTKRGSHSLLLLAGAAAALAFIVANPTLLRSPLEVIDGFVLESLFNSARGVGLPRAFLALVGQLPAALGLPMFLLTVAGFLYVLRLLQSPATRKEALLLLAMAVPYYVLIGSMRGPRAGPWLLPVPPMRYTLPLVPFLLIAAAKLSADLCMTPQSAVRGMARFVVAVVLAYSLGFALAADLQFMRDSRYAAREWILASFPPGARIETTSYGPDIPTALYAVRERPHDNNVADVVLASTRTPAFLRYQSARESVHEWLARWGLDPATAPYVPWAAKAEQRYAHDVMSFDVSVAGLEARAPEVFIVSNLYTTRFAENVSREGTFFADLEAGRSVYREVRRFHYQLPAWLAPEPEFVNPTLIAYAAARL